MPKEFIPNLLMTAWLLPLAGFCVEIFAGYWSGRRSRAAAYLAVACIVGAFGCSSLALWTWGSSTGWAALKSHGHDAHGADHHGDGHHGHGDAHHGDAHHGKGHGVGNPKPTDNAHPKHDDHEKKSGDAPSGEKARPGNQQKTDKEAGTAKATRSSIDPRVAAVSTSASSPPHLQREKLLGQMSVAPVAPGQPEAPSAPERKEAPQESTAAPHHPGEFLTGVIYTIGTFGGVKISLDYYVDSLTLVMFTMVTLIASMIHLFAIGYMADELTEHYEDHQVHTSHGHFHRPGRFYRFFAFLSLFSFSMLGLVLSGNILMVFIFWELVGACSFFLIGFYFERKSASTAANKAFIMNRVGDFGFLIGLMIILASFGTFKFRSGSGEPGLFDMVRGADGVMRVDQEDGRAVVVLTRADDSDLIDPVTGNHRHVSYALMIALGLGIFAGCVGKSAQFPLQTWLPDAMEGPTPVSALVHSATMVAAGVYLAGRFFPMFTPEVLLTIAYVGAITLFVAATIAIVATDIKRVLAYSTISQLGYMMLAIGIGGWAAGLFHLVTHAFFKSLLFLCSGSVIYGCHHVQEMPQMGGLWRKMPITAFTMLVAVIAICGLAIPGISLFGEKIAFSGYHSKDAIVATAMTYSQLNSSHTLLFFMPLVGAGITAFYMFRLWFYTFIGSPRDQHVYDHAHESPWVMTIPLIVLSVFAAFCALRGEEGPLFKLLLDSEPAGLAHGVVDEASGLTLPSHSQVHHNHAAAGNYALAVAVMGAVIAYLFYGSQVLNPSEVQSHFQGVYQFLVDKWRFDELYDIMFQKPTHVVASWFAAMDRVVIDGFLHAVSRATVSVSSWDRQFDEQVVDGFVNRLASATYGFGALLRFVQTGRLRQYVMFIALGVIGLWIILRMLG